MAEEGGVGELSEMRGRIRPNDEAGGIGLGIEIGGSSGGGEVFGREEIGSPRADILVGLLAIVLIPGTGLLNTVVKLSEMEAGAEPDPVDGQRCGCCKKVLTPPFVPLLSLLFHRSPGPSPAVSSTSSTGESPSAGGKVAAPPIGNARAEVGRRIWGPPFIEAICPNANCCAAASGDASLICASGKSAP